jgi:hypothetical protein
LAAGREGALLPERLLTALVDEAGDSEGELPNDDTLLFEVPEDWELVPGMNGFALAFKAIEI